VKPTKYGLLNFEFSGYSLFGVRQIFLRHWTVGNVTLIKLHRINYWLCQ